jgi:hypothetical protein
VYFLENGEKYCVFGIRGTERHPYAMKDEEKWHHSGYCGMNIG